MNKKASVNLNKMANIFVSYLGQLFSLQGNHGLLPIVQGHFEKYLNFLAFSYISIWFISLFLMTICYKH